MIKRSNVYLKLVALLVKRSKMYIIIITIEVIKNSKLDGDNFLYFRKKSSLLIH